MSCILAEKHILVEIKNDIVKMDIEGKTEDLVFMVMMAIIANEHLRNILTMAFEQMSALGAALEQEKG